MWYLLKFLFQFLSGTKKPWTQESAVTLMLWEGEFTSKGNIQDLTPGSPVSIFQSEICLYHTHIVNQIYYTTFHKSAVLTNPDM